MCSVVVVLWCDVCFEYFCDSKVPSTSCLFKCVCMPVCEVFEDNFLAEFEQQCSSEDLHLTYVGCLNKAIERISFKEELQEYGRHSNVMKILFAFGTGSVHWLFYLSRV